MCVTDFLSSFVQQLGEPKFLIGFHINFHFLLYFITMVMNIRTQHSDLVIMQNIFLKWRSVFVLYQLYFIYRSFAMVFDNCIII